MGREWDAPGKGQPLGEANYGCFSPSIYPSIAGLQVVAGPLRAPLGEGMS